MLWVISIVILRLNRGAKHPNRAVVRHVLEVRDGWGRRGAFGLLEEAMGRQKTHRKVGQCAEDQT